MKRIPIPRHRRSTSFVRRLTLCLVLCVILLTGLYLLKIAESLDPPWSHLVGILGKLFAEAVLVALILHALIDRVRSVGRRREKRLFVASMVARLLAVLDTRRIATIRGIEDTIAQCTLAIQGALQDRFIAIEHLTRRCASQLFKAVEELLTKLGDQLTHQDEQVHAIRDELASLRRLQATTIERIEDSQEEIIADLRDLMRLVETLRLVGIINLVRQMNIGELFQRLLPGDTLIFKDTFAPDYREWLGSLKDAVRRGVHVKMLAITPMCSAAESRASQLHSSLPDFMHQLQEFLNAMDEADRELKREAISGSFQIRLYSEPANYPLYLVIDSTGVPTDGFVSFFADQPTAYGVPHFVVGQPMVSSFYKDVSEMWERSRNVAT
jgi:hypothetical protein